MSATMDPDLLKLVQQHVNTLDTEVDQLTFEVQEDRQRVLQALKDISTRLGELETRGMNMQLEQEVMKQKQSSLSKTVEALHTEMDTRFVGMQLEQDIMKQEQSSLSKNMDTLITLQTDMGTTQVQLKNLQCQQEDVQQRVAHVEEQLNRGM